MIKPIHLHDITLCHGKKVCFADFTTTILPQSRIGIIGRNGSGKSSLLKLLKGQIQPSSGDVWMPKNLHLGYIPQIIDDPTRSGAERFCNQLHSTLAENPDILLLDEPTNHLDTANRARLYRSLKQFPGTLIIASHDQTLLDQHIDTLWHIHEQQITTFSGNYSDYLKTQKQQQTSLQQERTMLKREAHANHAKKMQEQKRAAASKRKGEKSIQQRKWPTVVSKAKVHRATQTAGKKQKVCREKSSQIHDTLNAIYVPKTIEPTFTIPAGWHNDGQLISISHADIGYLPNHPLLHDVGLCVSGKERIAIVGNNGSGKSTLLKAILDAPGVYKTGHWQTPKRELIGYLDQHYASLDKNLSAMDHIKRLCPTWSDQTIQSQLQTFLFWAQSACQTPSHNLSGGEKARLVLSMIAANPPKLLLLDEITNNLDLETRTHVAQVLSHYPGALILISHDHDFIEAIGIDRCYHIHDGTLQMH